jgi:hypothetical protein
MSLWPCENTIINNIIWTTNTYYVSSKQNNLKCFFSESFTIIHKSKHNTQIIMV